MALQICELKNSYSEVKLHLVKRKFWGGPGDRSVTTLQVQFFCEENPQDRTPIGFNKNKYRFELYDKKIHGKELCKACVDVIKAYPKGGSAQAKPSHP